MSTKSIITKVALMTEDKYKSSTLDAEEGVSILIHKGKPIGVTNQEGELTKPLIVAWFTKEEELLNILSVSRDRLFRHPFVPGIVVVNETGKVEGIISRERVSNEINALLERNITQGLAGSPRVPLIIYQCPEGDYEFIPFKGEPDHLCPEHKLKLKPKEIFINV